MTAIQLREELFREINPILDDESLLLKLLKYARKLTATLRSYGHYDDK